MSFRLSRLTVARPATEHLAGGRSPAGWRRITEQSAGAAHWLFGSCSWTGFVSQAAPRLMTGLLLGSGLEALTTEVRRLEPERQFHPSRRRFTPVPPPRPASAAERRFRTAGQPSDPSHVAANCLKQSPRASRESLTRLSGHAFAVNEWKQISTSARSTRVRQEIESLQKKSARNGRALKEVETADAAIEKLVRTLVERAARSAPPIRTVELLEQWCTHLTGPQAPGEFLEVAGTLGRASSPVSAAPPATVEGVPSGDEPPQSIAGANARPSPKLSRIERTEDVPVGWETEKEPRPELPALHSRPPVSKMSREFRPAVPASSGGVEPNEDEIMSDEDLSVLSGKIKRILEEEARRHGIDV